MNPMNPKASPSCVQVCMLRTIWNIACVCVCVCMHQIIGYILCVSIIVGEHEVLQSARQERDILHSDGGTLVQLSPAACRAGTRHTVQCTPYNRT